MLLILLCAAALLDWKLAHALRDEDANELREHVAALRAEYRMATDVMVVLEQEIVREAAAGRVEPYYLRYVDGGETIIETAGMAAILPVTLYAHIAVGEREQPVRWRSPSGNTYLIYAAPADSGSDRIFHAAWDITNDEVLLRSYRRALLAVVLIGSVLATLASSLMVRRGLRPLAHLSRVMQQITARRLDQRVGETDWPRELSQLVTVFDDMLGRLEESFTRLSRFSADLAHELRTPLTNLRGEAEVALAQARSAAEYQRILESALEEYDRLTSLVDRLLFLARADTGAAALEPRNLDAATEVQRVCDLYAALAEERGVNVDCTGEAAVSADPLLFRRAVANLLANALEHTPTGGRVVVAVDQQLDGTHVTVSDTGTGIPAEHLPHVTKRFYQADPSRARRAGGAGLGLALVRSIMELHSGSFQLESEPGRGTRATLLFRTSASRAPRR